ncbi:hypothetical protein SUNI508_05314 [Seiridium unicorne]|uniref:Extracellular serine-rich protein n=1 Tax=Seiridium unicorne TaxID=138068 RepID=A0ABR2V456_9PEZI
MNPLVRLLTLTAGLASATVHKINAGPGLKFSPENITAVKDDVLEFHFYAQNHSVALGDYDDACQFPESGGFFSGYIPASGSAEGSQVFRVTVNDTDPIWYYCTQVSHCKSGMVGVVNPPTDASDGSLEGYKKKAANFTGKAEDAASAFGGEVAAASSNVTSTTTSPTSTSTLTPTVSSGNSSSSSSNAAAAQNAVLGVMLCGMGVVACGLI